MYSKKLAAVVNHSYFTAKNMVATVLGFTDLT